MISIFTCFLLLTSNSELTYVQHFCGDLEMMALFSFGEANLSCGMADEKDTCENKDEDHSCCDNHFTKIVIDDNFQSAKHDLQLQVPLIFTTAFTFAFVLSIPEEENLQVSIPFSYISPPIHRDHQVLYETFLI